MVARAADRGDSLRARFLPKDKEPGTDDEEEVKQKKITAVAAGGAAAAAPEEVRSCCSGLGCLGRDGWCGC